MFCDNRCYFLCASVYSRSVGRVGIMTGEKKLQNNIVGGYGANSTYRTRVIQTGIVGLRDISVELGNICRRRWSVQGTCRLQGGESVGGLHDKGLRGNTSKGISSINRRFVGHGLGVYREQGLNCRGLRTSLLRVYGTGKLPVQIIVLELFSFFVKRANSFDWSLKTFIFCRVSPISTRLFFL